MLDQSLAEILPMGKPCSASSTAGRSVVREVETSVARHELLPRVDDARHRHHQRAALVPGVGCEALLERQRCGRRARAVEADDCAPPGSATSANASPPMPLDCGCTTPSTASAATAASTALPPSPSAQSAASTASRFDVATIADRAQAGDVVDTAVTGSSC